MLPVLFATVDLVPTLGPDTNKISNKETPVLGDEAIIPSKQVYLLSIANNLLQCHSRLAQGLRTTHIYYSITSVNQKHRYNLFGPSALGSPTAEVKVTPRAASHLKNCLGKGPFSSSPTCLLAGFSSLHTVGQRTPSVLCTLASPKCGHLLYQRQSL